MLAIDDSIVYPKLMNTILFCFLNYRTHMDCHDTQRIISFVERYLYANIDLWSLIFFLLPMLEAKAFMFRVLYM